jgi:endo-1,3(4)-beta-glucanase
MVLLGLMLLICACTGSSRPGGSPSSGAPTRAPLAAPLMPGLLGPTTPATRPSARPVQAAGSLVGRALPTNQWWTSALTGPWTQTLWAFPVAAKVGPDGVGVSAATPVASANAVVTAPDPVLTVGGPLSGVAVNDYGDFSVQLVADRVGGAPLRADVVQGLPYLRVETADRELPVRLLGSAAPDAVHLPDGSVLPIGAAAAAARVRITVADQLWDVVAVPTDGSAAAPAQWQRTGDGLTVRAGGPMRLLLAPVPEGAAPDWGTRVEAWARQPVEGTRSTFARTDRGVRQQLTWSRTGAPPTPTPAPTAGPVVALLAHQRATRTGPGTPVAGRYRTARGDLTLVQLPADGVLDLDVPLPGLLTGIPQLQLSAAEQQALRTDLDNDLAQAPVDGGSYYGPKELGRLATVVEVADRLGDEQQRSDALGRLRAGLEDWFSYSGPNDKHWLSYDTTWGGVIANPPEFGNQDYNDHHFQYGYLLRAAAVVGSADPGFVARYGPVVDLLVQDVLGSTDPALPDFRVWNAYQGHSSASGFAGTPDGGNQESSSEAVAAWEGAVRWGQVRGDQNLVDAALGRYAVEALAARTYWLGEGERLWPSGYQHDTAGIVWGGKTDFATFFDPRPEAVLGIELLPYTFGSLYRSDPSAAQRRSAVASTGGGPHLWPDLFAMDRALVDPGSVPPDPPTSIEPGNGRAFYRYWLLAWQQLGRPRTDLVADRPGALAFGTGRPILAAVNESATTQTFAWHDPAGRVVGTLTVAPDSARTAPG